MAKNNAPARLSKFIAYMLGRNPSEFGLVPDPGGFFKIKELLKAICEEEGFGNIRRSHLDEILLTVKDAPFEIHGNLIRARIRDKLTSVIPAVDLPKLLYIGIRRKAHANVLENGIRPMGYSRVILCSKMQMAERIARRKDREPVILTVQVASAVDSGVVFYKSGEGIFLADEIPLGCFSGPPVPKLKPEEKKARESAEPVERTPGSYIVEVFKDKPGRKKDNHKGKKEIAWKKERKRKQKIFEKW